MRGAARVNTCAVRVNMCCIASCRARNNRAALTKSVNEKSGLSFNVKRRLKISCNSPAIVSVSGRPSVHLVLEDGVMRSLKVALFAGAAIAAAFTSASAADLPPIMAPQPIPAGHGAGIQRRLVSARRYRRRRAALQGIRLRPDQLRVRLARELAHRSARDGRCVLSSAAALAISGIRGCASMPPPNTAPRPSSARSAATPSSAPAAAASTRMTETTRPSC